MNRSSLQYGIQSSERCECRLWSLKDKISSGHVIYWLHIMKETVWKELGKVDYVVHKYWCTHVLCGFESSTWYEIININISSKPQTCIYKMYFVEKRGEFCQMLILFIRCPHFITAHLPLPLHPPLSLPLCSFTAIRMQGCSCTLGSVCACVWSRQVGGGAVLVWVRSEVSRSHQPWHLINKSALFLLPQFSAHVRWRYRQHPVRVTEWSATRFGYRANLESMLFRTMRSPLSPGVGFNAIRSNCWFGSF